MLKIVRRYSLTDDLVAATATTNRSASVSAAIDKARVDPTILTRALIKRLTDNTEREPVAVTVSISVETIDKLSELAKMTRLPVEHVLRLALEAHLSQS